MAKSRVAALFCTVTATGPVVPTLPAASYARASSACAPSPAVVVSQIRDAAATASEPSSQISARTTPVLSAASASTRTVPENICGSGPQATEGAVVSTTVSCAWAAWLV